MTKFNKRIQYIDALRGFTMILVVFAHVLLWTFNLGNHETVIGSLFITFRMPMFFFISGYISYKSTQLWTYSYYKENMLKKVFVQIVPALIFFVIYNTCQNRSLYEILQIILNKGFGIYWFTFALLMCFLLYYSISFFCRLLNKNLLDIILIIFSMLGVLWLVVSEREGIIYNIVSLDKVAKYFQFFALGLLCKKYNEIFLKIISSECVKTILIISFLFLFYLSCNSCLEMSNGFLYSIVKDLLVRYAGLFVVFLFFLTKKDFFAGQNIISKMLQFVGRRTLDIYLLHYFFIPVMPYISLYVAPSNMIIIQLVFTLFITMLIVCVCLLCSEILRCSNTLSYILFGCKVKC